MLKVQKRKKKIFFTLNGVKDSIEPDHEWTMEFSQPASEFSREKNITQREVMEAALVKYLQKYGFKHGIEALLKNQ